MALGSGRQANALVAQTPPYQIPRENLSFASSLSLPRGSPRVPSMFLLWHNGKEHVYLTLDFEEPFQDSAKPKFGRFGILSTPLTPKSKRNS
jgi:hypothetical protein